MSCSFVVAGKCAPEEAAEIVTYSNQTPRFGRYWWFWVPRLNWNGGLPWRDRATDVSVNWLCFKIGYVFWRNGPSLTGRWGKE